MQGDRGVSLTFTDLFCGAGGSSIGLTGAGLELKLAANHWDRAIETHKANFPDADHLCEDIDKYDMRRLPKTDVLWASPICTEISPAGGRARKKKQPSRDQVALFEDGPVAQEGFDRTRATFHDVIRATEVHGYDVVIVENVVEAATDWRLFGWWLSGMRQLDYKERIVCVSAAHIGGPGNDPAAQWRDRKFTVFTRKGVPAPDITPRPLAWCAHCGVDVRAVQRWNHDAARIAGHYLGKYRQQYVYRCPNTRAHSRMARKAISATDTVVIAAGLVEPYVMPAAAVIDWSDLGVRVGDREALGKRPLVPNTLARIQAGMAMFAGPHLSPVGGTWNTVPTDVGMPMRTRLANEKGYEAIVCPPFIVNTNHAGDDGRAYPADSAPLAPRTTKIGEAVVTSEPFITILRNHATATPVSGPLATVTTGGKRGGGHHYLTMPPGATPPDGRHSLVIPYYRTGKAKTTRDPLDTVTTRDRFALVRTDGTDLPDVQDCRVRMVQPREHLRAQRFHDGYVVTGNRGEQTMQAGNAVPANVAQWLGQQVAAALGGSGRGA
jgi:DNA (cytosine-5)-methyltransferase 1